MHWAQQRNKKSSMETGEVAAAQDTCGTEDDSPPAMMQVTLVQK
jgi:hypothetical protein